MALSHVRTIQDLLSRPLRALTALRAYPTTVELEHHWLTEIDAISTTSGSRIRGSAAPSEKRIGSVTVGAML
jgi:hypothetical protein